MKDFLKKIFCRHKKQTFVRNVYGDEIIAFCWYRSLWRCDRCQKIIPKEWL